MSDHMRNEQTSNISYRLFTGIYTIVDDFYFYFFNLFLEKYKTAESQSAELNSFAPSRTEDCYALYCVSP